MAWLPMMMSFVSPVRSATARMACSSWSRVIAAGVCRRGDERARPVGGRRRRPARWGTGRRGPGRDCVAFFVGDETRERVRASQPLAFVSTGEEDGADFQPRKLQDIDPFLACPGELAPARSFAREVFVGDPEPVRIFVNLPDDESTHVERSGVDVWVADPALVRAHAHLFERRPVVAAPGLGLVVVQGGLFPIVKAVRRASILRSRASPRRSRRPRSRPPRSRRCAR